MAPKSCQESECERVPSAPASGKPVGSDSGPEAGVPAGTRMPVRPQSTKCTSTPTPVACSVNQQLTPETLDPRTLRLLWEQRELEIQALRWVVHNGQNARSKHILQEVAGIPPERTFKNQDKFLQNQIQKLTMEMKAKEEQAQMEKENLEEQVKQNLCAIQQLEAELQSFQKSCLLQLARSSWLGRMLRSQTGSVEVVTAEVLRDLSDSENDENPVSAESFRLEDVDWNSIAHRYPNLFANFSFTSEQKQPHVLSSSVLDTWDLESPLKPAEKPGKSLEWSNLPLRGTSSSGGADSDSSSCQPAEHSRVKRVMGHPPQKPDPTPSEQIQAGTGSFGGHVEDLQRSHLAAPNKAVLEARTDSDHQHARPPMNPVGCCLKIVAVSHRDKFIRILNQSESEPIDLGGFVLQQVVRDFPVGMYRFPPNTLLEPGYHITVWGEGTSRTKKQFPVSLGQDPFYFQSSRGCVTMLINPQGQVLSEHQTPPCVTLGSRIFKDNTDWSIDRFPISEAPPDADTREQKHRPSRRRKGRVREAGARRRRPGPGPRQEHLSVGGLRPPGPPRPTGPKDILPSLSIRKPLHPGEHPAQTKGTRAPSEILPVLLETRVCQEDAPARQERKVLVCRKSVDCGCPMVALSVQNTAESRYGFRFLCCPPITEELCRRL